MNIPQILKELSELTTLLELAQTQIRDANADISEAKIIAQGIQLQMGLMTLEVEALESKRS